MPEQQGEKTVWEKIKEGWATWRNLTTKKTKKKRKGGEKSKREPARIRTGVIQRKARPSPEQEEYLRRQAERAKRAGG